MLRYEILANRLRERLRSCPEDRLPPLATIAQEEGFSINTVQRAVSELKQEGLLVTRTGIGTFPASASGEWGQSNHPNTSSSPETPLPIRVVGFDRLSVYLNSFFFREFYTSLEGLANQEGHPVLYHNVVLQRRLMPLSSNFLNHSAFGTIFFEPFSESYLAQVSRDCHPLVSIDSDMTALGIDSVVLENQAGALLATYKLLALGHRRIAYLGSCETSNDEAGADPAIGERFHGFSLAHAALDAKPLPELCKGVKGRDPDSVSQALDKLLKEKESFTALVAYDESFAEHAIRRLRDAGMQVPEDISVVAAAGVERESTISGTYFEVSQIAQIALDLLKEYHAANDRTSGSTESARGRRVTLDGEFRPGTTLSQPREQK